MEVGLHVYEPGGPASFSDFSRWRPPDVGIYKLNIGICISSSSTQVGLGFLIRDAQKAMWWQQCNNKWLGVMIGFSYKLLQF